MTTTLATREVRGELVAVPPQYTEEQIKLIKRNICVDSTHDELELFLHRCKATGLDPFLRQIYSIKRGNKHTIQVGIDGLRLVATRTGERDGEGATEWCGPDGVWVEAWLERFPPAACRVTVYRRGQTRGYQGVAVWAEYAGDNVWKKMPSVMIAKCAESVALRKAFPQELSGLYSQEEMGQAGEDESPRRVPAAAAAPVDPEMLKLHLKRTGWGWGRAVGAINVNSGSAYDPKSKPGDLDQATLADFYDWLEQQPDAPAVEKDIPMKAMDSVPDAEVVAKPEPKAEPAAVKVAKHTGPMADLAAFREAGGVVELFLEDHGLTLAEIQSAKAVKYSEISKLLQAATAALTGK